MSPLIIGIDPGKSGGIAYTDPESGKAIAVSMPDSPSDIVVFLKACVKEGATTIFIEQLPRFVAGAGGKGPPGSRVAVLFENFGIILGAAMAFGLSVVRVDPKRWQLEHGLGTANSCASKTIWKNKLKARAQELFPDLKVTLKTADALLIWEYGRRLGV